MVADFRRPSVGPGSLLELLRFVLPLLLLVVRGCQCQEERRRVYSSSSPSPTTDFIVRGLRARGFSGSVHPYSSYGYERYRRVKNGACNRVLFPLVIVRPASARDVAVGIKVAREVGMEVSVRSGGHGYTCNSIKNGSLHLDLRRLDKVELVREPYSKVRILINWESGLLSRTC